MHFVANNEAVLLLDAPAENRLYCCEISYQLNISGPMKKLHNVYIL